MLTNSKEVEGVRNERKLKQEIRRKRSELLLKIDFLNTQRCAECIATGRNIGQDNPNCGCDAATKIREIGRQLDELVAPRKNESTELLNTLFVPENLTPELYARLKFLGVRDDVICKRIKMRRGNFPQWKRENGMGGKYKKGEHV